MQGGHSECENDSQCELVGYAMGARMTQELTAQALWRAVRNKRPKPGLIHHSDRGS